MKKISSLLLICIFLLSACRPQPSAAPATETATASPAPSATATVTITPTVTSSPTPSVQFKIFGLNYGPFTQEGQNPNEGTIIPVEQLEREIAQIAPYTQWIRTYGCSGLEQVVAIAHQHDLNVAMGAWLSKDENANTKEITCLIENAKVYQPEMVIVGNETLYRKDLTSNQLLGYLDQVRTALPDTLVTTSDTSGSWFDHPDLLTGVDVVLANIYPYWERISVDEAVLSINLTYQRLTDLAKDKEVWIAETGWPDEGKILDDAEPSPENAAYYFLNFISWASLNNIRYFYFEAYDEPWKATLENPQESHWGLWINELMKPGMERVFNGEVLPDNWTPTETPTPTVTPKPAATKEAQATLPAATPSISIGLPAGSNWPKNGIVFGYAKNADPSKYKVAVYIRVGDGWWTKPLWDYPLTDIDSTGYWECPYITGGNDAEAREIVAYLVANGSSVPLASGGGLPSIDSAPIARISR